jgi:hypothetical protein
MSWRGATQPITGLISAPVAASQVNAFSVENILNEMTFRLSDPPGTGNSITVRLQNNEAGDDLTEELTLSDLETFKQSLSLTMSVGTLWLEVSAVTGSPTAMNLSGEYVMNSVTGVTDEFTTLEKVKYDAKITGADANRDTVLLQMIAGVTAQMQGWMGRSIVQGTATAEKVSPFYDDEIHVEHYPIIEIASLEENGTALVADTDYEANGDDIRSGRIVRISGGYPSRWLAGRRTVEITYDYGYVTVPEDLVTHATALVVAKFHETVQSGKSWRGLLSKGVDPNSSTTFDKDIWTRETIPAMQPFRRRVA